MDVELINLIEVEHQKLTLLIKSISSDIAEQPNLLGWWSARQMLAHLIGWQEGAIAVVTAVRDATLIPDEEDEDTFNAKSVARYQDKNWLEMQQAFAETNARLITLARSLPEAAWENPYVPNWLRGSTINHYPTHINDFRRALPNI